MASELHRCAAWQAYVSAYTAVFGLPLLLVPGWAVPLLGFGPAAEPWPRLVGMLLLGFSMVSAMICREPQAYLVVVSTAVRAFFAGVLLTLAVLFGPRFLFLMSAVVLVGVIGSSLALRAEVLGRRA